MLKAVQIALNITRPYDTRFQELLQPKDLLSEDDPIDQVADHAVSIRTALWKMTDHYFVSQGTVKYPKEPRSDLVSAQRFS